MWHLQFCIIRVRKKKYHDFWHCSSPNPPGRRLIVWPVKPVREPEKLGLLSSWFSSHSHYVIMKDSIKNNLRYKSRIYKRFYDLNHQWSCQILTLFCCYLPSKCERCWYRLLWQLMWNAQAQDKETWIFMRQRCRENRCWKGENNSTKQVWSSKWYIL